MCGRVPRRLTTPASAVRRWRARPVPQRSHQCRVARALRPGEIGSAEPHGPHAIRERGTKCGAIAPSACKGTEPDSPSSVVVCRWGGGRRKRVACSKARIADTRRCTPSELPDAHVGMARALDECSARRIAVVLGEEDAAQEGRVARGQDTALAQSRSGESDDAAGDEDAQREESAHGGRGHTRKYAALGRGNRSATVRREGFSPVACLLG